MGAGQDIRSHGIRRTAPARPLLLIVLFGLFALVSTAAGAPGALVDAERALNEDRPAEALALLAPMEVDLAGDPAFDYLYGLALLETGSPGRAIFAFERILMLDPVSPAARIEMARAYYALGRLDEAEAEFSALRAENPPPAARRAIDEYVDLISTRRGADALVTEFNLGLAGGHDSNANSATAIPRFLGFDLVDESRETESPFIQYSGSGRLAKPLREGLLLDTRLSLAHRSHSDADFVDSTVLSGSGGLRWVGEGHSATLRLSGYRLNVDGDLNSQGGALNAAWEKELSRNLRGGAIARLGVVRYDDELAVKDVDQLLVGGRLAWTFGAERQGELVATALLGRDEATESGSRYSRDVYGLKFAGGWGLTPTVRLTFSASGLVGDYDDVFFEQLYDETREDTLVQGAFGIEWRVSRRWLFRHLLAYSRNITDVEIFEYDRLQISVSIDRQWR